MRIIASQSLKTKCHNFPTQSIYLQFKLIHLRVVKHHQPWQFERENTLVWGAADHGLYCQWKPRAPSAMASTNACGLLALGPIDGAHWWFHGQCCLWLDLSKSSRGCNKMRRWQEAESDAGGIGEMKGRCNPTTSQRRGTRGVWQEALAHAKTPMDGRHQREERRRQRWTGGVGMTTGGSTQGFANVLEVSAWWEAEERQWDNPPNERHKRSATRGAGARGGAGRWEALGWQEAEGLTWQEALARVEVPMDRRLLQYP